MRVPYKKLLALLFVILIIAAYSISAASVRNAIKVNTVGTSLTNTELTLIIDAGHGGEDGGAVSNSGVKESGINLEIAVKLDQIMGFFGVRTVMTRTSEALDYSQKSDTIREKKVEDQKRRLQLINTTNNAVLLSIHQNKFPDGGPFGTQILYAPTNGSKEFGTYMQDLVIGALNAKSRRAVAKVPNSIMLLNHIKCPALIVECGFLSNPEEEKLLGTDTYRLKLAAVIAAGYLYNQDDLKNVVFGGTNESEDSILLHRLRQ